MVSAFPVTEMEIRGAGEKLELYLSGLTHKDKVALLQLAFSATVV